VRLSDTAGIRSGTKRTHCVTARGAINGGRRLRVLDAFAPITARTNPLRKPPHTSCLLNKSICSKRSSQDPRTAHAQTGEGRPTQRTILRLAAPNARSAYITTNGISPLERALESLNTQIALTN
jgi:hypothetical protein